MLERGAVVAAVVDRALPERDSADRVRHLAGVDEVAPPDVGRIEPELGRDAIDQPLADERALIPSGAAVGAGRRLVGEHAQRLALVVLHPVRPGQQRDRQLGDDHAVRADVGAEIGDEPVAQRDDRAVAAHADLDLVVLLPRVVGRHQVLATILDPLHRPAQAHRRPRHHEVLGIELAAHAEAAAHLELEEVDQVLRMAEQVGEHPPVEVRHLGHAPQGEHARPRIVRGREPPRLHRDAGVALDGEALGETPLGGRERVCRIAGARHQPLDDVAAGGRMEDRHARIARAARVGDDGQRLPVDLDELERVLGEVAAGGDHEDNRLADVPDHARRERRLQARRRTGARALAEPHRNARDRPEVVRGDHRGDTGDRACRGGPNGGDTSVRMRRPQDCRVQQTRQAHVGSVLAAPGQEANVFLALHGNADHAVVRRVLEAGRRRHEPR